MTHHPRRRRGLDSRSHSDGWAWGNGGGARVRFGQIDVNITDALRTTALDELAFRVLYLVQDFDSAERKARENGRYQRADFDGAHCVCGGGTIYFYSCLPTVRSTAYLLFESPFRASLFNSLFNLSFTN